MHICNYMYTEHIYNINIHIHIQICNIYTYIYIIFTYTYIITVYMYVYIYIYICMYLYAYLIIWSMCVSIWIVVTCSLLYLEKKSRSHSDHLDCTYSSVTNQQTLQRDSALVSCPLPTSKVWKGILQLDKEMDWYGLVGTEPGLGAWVFGLNPSTTHTVYVFWQTSTMLGGWATQLKNMN